MKYSVIIPFYNSAIWLERCVSSVVKQEGDFEFLFIDDHSTDGGDKIITCYSDPRIRLMTNTHQKGVSGARNTGLDNATGDWITFLDADDEMLPNSYEVFERMILEDAVIIQAQHLRHYVTGRTINKYPHEEGEYDLEQLPPMWYMVWNKLFKADFVKGIKFVEGLQYGEDQIFILDCLAKCNRIIAVDEVMTLRHFDNIHSLSKAKSKEQLIQQAHAIEDFIMRCDNPKARLRACKTLSENWGSEVYRRAFE